MNEGNRVHTELISLVSDFSEVFVSDSVEEDPILNSVRQEVADINKRNVGAKTAIRELQNSCIDENEKLFRLKQSKNLHIDKLEKEYEHLCELQLKSTKSKKEVEEAVISLQKHVKDVTDRIRELEAPDVKFTCSTMNTYDIYPHISNIEWTCSEHDNVLKGYILQPTTKNLIDFELDSSKHSQYFITNFLWKSIGSGKDQFL